MANIERLEQLKRVVMAAPDDRFDMDIVGRQDCGSAHCAWGWAYHDQWFIEHTEIRDPDGMFNDSPGVFDLDADDVDALFQPPEDSRGDRDGIKEEVIENINRIIAGIGAIPYESFDDEDEDYE